MGNAEHEDPITMLTAAVNVVENWPADRYAEHKQVVTRLEELLAAYNEEIQIWQYYQNTELKRPLSPGPRGSIAVWLGEPRAHKLMEINERVNGYLWHITALTGVGPMRDSPSDEAMLQVAEQQLQAHVEDPGPYAGRIALQHLEERIARIGSLLDSIRIVD